MTLSDAPNPSEVFKPLPEFRAMSKIPRLMRNIIITEKIDGTNAQIYIDDQGGVYAGKRTGWITPENDNHGFAKWVEENKDELRKLGKGRHFGEWWGKGINRGYGIQERRFTLFNPAIDGSITLSCVSRLPVLYSGLFDVRAIESSLSRLRESGSVAAPGWMKPEGIVVYHEASGQRFKITLENDGIPKGLSDAK